jgi:hypothetical protein
VSHFAELDRDNVVLRVIVVDNFDTVKDSVKIQYPILTSKESLKVITGTILKINNTDVEWEDEQKGIEFCRNLLGGNWIQTSYNDNIRRRFAGRGYTYDRESDVFIEPQPYPSWKLDKDYNWVAPEPRPDDREEYEWNEKEQKWALVERM